MGYAERPSNEDARDRDLSAPDDTVVDNGEPDDAVTNDGDDGDTRTQDDSARGL